MESIFQQVGGCGCFQISFVLLTQTLRIVSIWPLYLMMFGNYEPPWQCVQYVRRDNRTLLNASDHLSSQYPLYPTKTYLLENSDPTTKSTTSSINNDSFNSMTWIVNKSANGQINYRVTMFHPGTCDLLSQCDDVIFDPKSVTLVSDFRLICDRAYIPSAIIAAQMVGMLVGSFVGGQLGEALGRKTNLLSSMVLMSVTTFTSSWSTSWQMHLGLLFMTSIGAGGMAISNLVYTMEFLNTKWRWRVGAAPMLNIAIMLLACIIVVLKNWRQVHLACGALAGLFVLFALWVPESIRWLHVHEREDESKKVLAKIMKYNQRRGNVTKVLERLKEDKEGEETSSGRRFTYLDLFRTPKICAMTIKVGIILFVLVTSFITLNFSVKELHGDYYTNLFLSCLPEFPLTLLLYLSINTLGRKITASLFMFLALTTSIACVIAYYAVDEEISGTIIKYLAITAKGSISVAWTTMNIFCVELFPTAVRNVALGFGSTIARIGAILGTILIPNDPQSLSICFCILGGFLVIAFGIIMTLPETKNKPLDDKITEPQNKIKRWEQNDVHGPCQGVDQEMIL